MSVPGLISIILPVYNTDRYLKRCLDSLLAQTRTEIEILAVNDGSTDESARILEEYHLADSRIHILTRENGGLSAARNDGLAAARGTYVCFMDSDDWIEESLLGEAVQALARDGRRLRTRRARSARVIPGGARLPGPRLRDEGAVFRKIAPRASDDAAVAALFMDREGRAAIDMDYIVGLEHKAAVAIEHQAVL